MSTVMHLPLDSTTDVTSGEATAATFAITSALRSIAGDWPSLLEAMYLPTSTGSGPSSGDAHLPGGTERLDLAEGVTRLLAYWCYAALDSHACPTVRLTVDDVPGMCAWLARPEQVAWLQAQPEGFDAAIELTTLARRLAGVVAPSGIRRPPVGNCPHGVCEGTVRARLGADDLTGAELVCDVDPDHRWDEHAWRDLAKALGHITADAPERMRPEVLAEWLTQRFGRPFTASTVRNWPSRYPWFPRPDDDGAYDRIRVTEWLIGRMAA
jgi:hypothetical protein